MCTANQEGRRRIKLLCGKIRLEGWLNDSDTARALVESLPYESSVNTWGDEIYFSVPVSSSLDHEATDVVEPGTICFWVEGSSVAIPFGPTPVSQGDECRLVTRVNLIGMLDSALAELKEIKAGDTVRLEEA